MATLEDLARQWREANAAGDETRKNQLHQQAVAIRAEQDKNNGTTSTYNAASGKWTVTPSTGTVQSGGGNGGLSGGSGGVTSGSTTYIDSSGQSNPCYYTQSGGTATGSGTGTGASKPLDWGQQIQKAMQEGADYQVVQGLLNSRLHAIDNDPTKERYRYDTINQSAQAYIDAQKNKAQAEQLNSTYAAIEANQRAAARAAVEQAVNGLSGQKTTMDQSYADLFRQLYIDRRMAEKNLPQQMAAMGYTGGMTETSALQLKTNYEQQLQAGEQERLKSLAELDRAITDARLTGDISVAEQAAELAQNRYNSYADLLAQQQSQANWLAQLQYQQKQDAAVLSRQQIMDEMEREDTAYQRKLTFAQYLYETTGDASGFRGLGAYTDEQIAALSAQAKMLSAGTSTGKSRGGGTADEELQRYVNRFNSGEQSEDVIQYLLNHGYTEEELRKNGYLGEQGRRAMAALAAAGAAGKNAAKNTASFGPAEMSRIARNVAKFVSMSGVGSAKWAEEVEKALDNGSLTEAEANELLKMYGYDT